MTLVNDTTQLNEQEKETKSSEQNIYIKLYNERNTKDFLYDIAWFNIISFAAWFCGLTPESESNSTHSTYLLTINQSMFYWVLQHYMLDYTSTVKC